MMNVPSISLPMRVTDQDLEKQMRPGDPVIVLVAKGIGSTQPYEFRDRDGRSYLLTWEMSREGHVLRLPWQLWMEHDGQLAHAIMNKRRMPFTLVALVEWTRPVAGAAQEEAGEPAGTETEAPHNDVLRCPAMVEALRGGAMRLKVLARHLEVTEAGLREALARPESPAELNAAGWVRVKPSAL